MTIVRKPTLLFLLTGSTLAQQPLPVLDMHLHALAADANGPPPLGLCVPVLEHVARDPQRLWGELFIE
jgi:hypothetical protein